MSTLPPGLSWAIWAILAVGVVLAHLSMWRCAGDILRRHHESRPLRSFIAAFGIQIILILVAEAIRSAQADARRLAGVQLEHCAPLSITVPADGKGQDRAYLDLVCVLRLFTFVSDWQVQRWNDEAIRDVRVHGRCHVGNVFELYAPDRHVTLRARLFDQSSFTLRLPATYPSVETISRLNPGDCLAFRGEMRQISRNHDEPTPAELDILADWTHLLKRRTRPGAAWTLPSGHRHQVREGT